jgi:hypothetical protein
VPLHLRAELFLSAVRFRRDFLFESLLSRLTEELLRTSDSVGDYDVAQTISFLRMTLRELRGPDYKEMARLEYENLRAIGIEMTSRRRALGMSTDNIERSNHPNNP